MSEVHNKLNRPKTYRLNKWLEENIDDANNLASMRKVAEQATQSLGFQVTEFNISAAYSATENKRPRTLAAGSSSGGGSKDARSLARAFLQLFRMLEKELGIEWRPDNFEQILKIAERLDK